MHVNTDSKAYDTINVTPMLDLAYVLLVVFILMTTATVQGLSITMPKPSNKPNTEKHDVRIVQILPQDVVLINGVMTSMAELESHLNDAKARDAKVSVVIKGDPQARYDQVVMVIDLCNKLQINMGLATSRIGT